MIKTFRREHLVNLLTLEIVAALWENKKLRRFKIVLTESHLSFDFVLLG